VVRTVSVVKTRTYPRPTKSRRASRLPSKAAHRVGVMPSSSLLLQSLRVASFNMSRIPSFAALKSKKWISLVSVTGLTAPQSQWGTEISRLGSPETRKR
jgi:hypothetical protein